jgi:histone deacetylase 1/2
LLNNILHVPDASKNLLSVNHIAFDNHAYVEFWPKFFLIKDQVTKKVVHRGKCRGGLYPLIPHDKAQNKEALSATKISSSRWHSCLGHPSFSIVERVLKNNNLPFQGKLESVCDACQKAKIHQLPYSISTSVSTIPLELVFSDVWGPAPTSVGRHNYYVSFIDDFSKFTWIYLIKKKSDVFQVFHNFQALVERQFGRKILALQSDWGGEYEKLNSFFQ